MTAVSPFHPGWRHVAGNRFPLKHAWDLLSLAQILVRGDVLHNDPLTIRKKLNCIRFYLSAAGIRRLQVAPPRAGTHWMQLGVSLALDLAQGGDGEWVYEHNRFYPREGRNCQRLDWRIPTGLTEKLDARSSGPALGKQHYFAFHQPYFRIRCAPVKKMKIVVVTRSIFALLESRYFKFAAISSNPDVTLDDEDSFDWDRYLSDIIAFFNSWGDVMTWHPAIRHYTFEDLTQDPVGTHKDMLDFWGFYIPEECIAEGFERASKKEMLKRMPAAVEGGNIRVSTRGSDRRGIISEARKRHIANRLSQELIHDFGHHHHYDTDYGIAYD